MHALRSVLRPHLYNRGAPIAFRGLSASAPALAAGQPEPHPPCDPRTASFAELRSQLLARLGRGEKPRRCFYEAMLRKCASLAEAREIAELQKEFRKRYFDVGLQSSTLYVRVMHQHGDLQDPLEPLKNRTEIGVAPGAGAYVSALRKFRGVKDADGVKRALEVFLNDPTSKLTPQITGEFVYTFCKLGQPAQAHQVIAAAIIADAKVLTSTVNMTLSKFVEMNDKAGAERLLQLVESRKGMKQNEGTLRLKKLIKEMKSS